MPPDFLHTTDNTPERRAKELAELQARVSAERRAKELAALGYTEKDLDEFWSNYRNVWYGSNAKALNSTIVAVLCEKYKKKELQKTALNLLCEKIKSSGDGRSYSMIQGLEAAMAEAKKTEAEKLVQGMGQAAERLAQAGAGAVLAKVGEHVLQGLSKTPEAASGEKLTINALISEEFLEAVSKNVLTQHPECTIENKLTPVSETVVVAELLFFSMHEKDSDGKPLLLAKVTFTLNASTRDTEVQVEGADMHTQQQGSVPAVVGSVVDAGKKLKQGYDTGGWSGLVSSASSVVSNALQGKNSAGNTSVTAVDATAETKSRASMAQDIVSVIKKLAGEHLQVN